MDYYDNIKPIKVYRCRDLSVKQMRFVAAVKAGFTASRAAAEAGYKKAERDGSRLMQTARIKKYLAKHRIKSEVRITKERVLEKLITVVDKTIKDDETSEIDVQLAKVGITALSEISKIEGYYAPTQTQNLNVNADATIEDIRNVRNEYKKDK